MMYCCPEEITIVVAVIRVACIVDIHEPKHVFAIWPDGQLPAPCFINCSEVSSSTQIHECRGCSDQFTVEDTELGDLSHVTLGHDSAGKSPSWHLEALVITHEPSGRQWSFGGGLWFDLQQGDGLTQRDLYPIR